MNGVKILAKSKKTSKPAAPERFSHAHATLAEFLTFYINIKHPETCRLLIGVAELAAILRKKKGTVAGYVTEHPERLPTPLDKKNNSRHVLWHLCDAHNWSLAATTATPPPPSPLPAQMVKRGPGRPPRFSSCNA